MRHARSLTWLAAGALLLAAEAHTPALFLAPWIALTLVLRATRTMPPWPGLAYVFVALYAALAVGDRGILPMGGPVYFAVVIGISLVTLLPFGADRLVAPHVGGGWSAMVFPMAWVAAEFLSARLTPAATWGSIAYTQYGVLPLMQVAAFTGIWGVSFLIAAFASVVNGAWDRGFEGRAVRPIVLGYAGLLCLVLLGGALRLTASADPADLVRAAVVSFPREMFVPGEVTRIYEGRFSPEERRAASEKTVRVQDWFLASTEREARAGARVVAWPETNLVVLAEDEPAFLRKAERLAADERVFLAMGMATVHDGQPHSMENKVVLVDPSGRLLFSHLKSRPVVGWEASTIKTGEPVLPLSDTAMGRIGAAICFEADFPELVRQLGQARADLWILPANDWAAVKELHLHMAAFRAIETGAPLLRAASSGISAVVDPWGRVLGMTDHFSGVRTMIAEVPMHRISTLYARAGDLFAWLCVAGCGAAAIRAGLASLGRDARAPGAVGREVGDVLLDV